MTKKISRSQEISSPLGLEPDEEAPKGKSIPRFEKGKFKIDWISTTVIFVPPIMILAAYLYGVELQFKTAMVGLLFYFLNGFGITMGYHRLFSHRAFSAGPFLRWSLLLFGGGAFQGSAKWWCRNHRIHHRYVDTDKDPYNAHRGFFYTHIGWMLMKQDYRLLGRVDVSDFKNDWAINFQHNNYLPIGLFFGVGLPTLICGLGWGDWSGGYFYAALLKMVTVHHTTFFINSLAHSSFMGAEQHFSEEHSSFDSPFCAFLTLGEGYHNFHHEFAQDYRNGIRWYHYDPTKWLIRGCEMLGLAYNLVRVPNEVIKRNIYELRAKVHSRELDDAKKKIALMERNVQVPVFMTWAEFEAACAKGRKLIVIGNYVLDMEKKVPTGSGYTHKSSDVVWYEAHPGGKQYLDMFVGKDATDAISGGIYRHHEGALNLFHHLRVAHIVRYGDPIPETTQTDSKKSR